LAPLGRKTFTRPSGRRAGEKGGEDPNRKGKKINKALALFSVALPWRREFMKKETAGESVM